MFKSNLNVLSYFTKHKKVSLNYLIIILQLYEAKYKAIHGKGCPSMLASRPSD